MKTTRSKGVTIFGIWFIIWSSVAFILGIVDPKTLTFYGIFISTIGLILAISILRLKEWARKGIIYYNIFTALIAVFLIFPKTYPGEDMHIHIPVMISADVGMVIITFVVAYFFTRPKVKEQFA